MPSHQSFQKLRKAGHSLTYPSFSCFVYKTNKGEDLALFSFGKRFFKLFLRKNAYIQITHKKSKWLHTLQKLEEVRDMCSSEKKPKKKPAKKKEKEEEW